MTVRNILVEISCKNCFYHTHIKSYTLVLADLEPTLKDRILEHTMFTYRCPRCGSEITFLHNFLYRDRIHEILIYMSQEDKDISELKEQFPSWRLRFVRSPQALKEKIRILEDGLDDRLIEILKMKLAQRYLNHATFTYQDQDEQGVLWFQYQDEHGMDLKGIEQGSYIRLQEQYKDVLSQHHEYEIDSAWSQRIKKGATYESK